MTQREDGSDPLVQPRTMSRPETADVRFLQDEGFDLLADYRQIDDPDVRRAIREFIISLGRASPTR